MHHKEQNEKRNMRMGSSRENGRWYIFYATEREEVRERLGNHRHMVIEKNGSMISTLDKDVKTVQVHRMFYSRGCVDT